MSKVEQTIFTLFRIREQYAGDPLFVDLLSSINYAGELLAVLDDSNQREPDMLGIMDGMESEQYTELVWGGINPPSSSVRRDSVKIYADGRVDFTVTHDGELTAYFSESFEGYIQLIEEMRETELQSLTLEKDVPFMFN